MNDRIITFIYKFRRLKKNLRQWCKNAMDNIYLKKKKLYAKIDELDKLEEDIRLLNVEWQHKIQYKTMLEDTIN